MSEVNGEENVSLAYHHNELTYEQERKQSDAKEVLIPVEENASLERKLLEESTRAGDLTQKLALNDGSAYIPSLSVRLAYRGGCTSVPLCDFRGGCPSNLLGMPLPDLLSREAAQEQT